MQAIDQTQLVSAATQTRVDCSHCGLAVPPGLVEPGDDDQFCCSGCRSVYGFLHDHELRRYYELADDRAPATVTNSSYAELDGATFAELYVRDCGDGEHEVDLYLEGVHCTACVWLVEKLPSLVAGVTACRLDIGRNKAVVRWRTERTTLSAVARFLDSLGYQVHPYRGASLDDMRRKESRKLLIRIAVAGAVAGNVGLVAAALYSGRFGGMSGEHQAFFRWISFVVTIPAVVFSGAIFFRGAFAALRARSLHLDLPISIGIAAGFGWGAWNTVRGEGEIYFDTVAALIFLLLVGRWLQMRQQRRATNAAELLHALAPSVARVVDGTTTRQVPVETLLIGAVVEVRAGETIPVDGTIVDGRAAIDSSLLTGESVPVELGVGDDVHAGTLNTSARLRITCAAAGEATRVGRLMDSLERDSHNRAPIVRAADRLAGLFVVIALGLAALTFALWYPTSPSQAMEHAIALLIITCPCALGLATPLAVNVAVGRAARSGLLIKGGAPLESLARPGTIFLDKTGTVTQGEQAVVSVVGSADAVSRAGALQAHSAHPVARAVVAYVLGTNHDANHKVSDAREITGAGMLGDVDGHALIVGSPRFVEANIGTLPSTINDTIAQMVARVLTPLVLAQDGQVSAVLGLGDPIRDDANALVDEVRHAGWQVRLLSGDHPDVVRSVGQQLGLDDDACLGGASPEDKRRFVEQARVSGTVVMVGDGVNDTAAMAAATCGVAVHGSAEASLLVADVYINRPGLTGVAQLLAGARLTLRTIHRNLAFSLLYNAVGVGLAISGTIDPLLAAILMPLSSLTVITSSYRSRSFDVESSR